MANFGSDSFIKLISPSKPSIACLTFNISCRQCVSRNNFSANTNSCCLLVTSVGSLATILASINFTCCWKWLFNSWINSLKLGFCFTWSSLSKVILSWHPCSSTLASAACCNLATGKVLAFSNHHITANAPIAPTAQQITTLRKSRSIPWVSSAITAASSMARTPRYTCIIFLSLWAYSIKSGAWLALNFAKSRQIATIHCLVFFFTTGVLLANSWSTCFICIKSWLDKTSRIAGSAYFADIAAAFKPMTAAPSTACISFGK